MRPVHRTRDEVISILESARASGGDSAFDDFIGVSVDDPVLENVRRRCLDLTLAPVPVFDEELAELLAELRTMP